MHTEDREQRSASGSASSTLQRLTHRALSPGLSASRHWASHRAAAMLVLNRISTRLMAEVILIRKPRSIRSLIIVLLLLIVFN